MTAMTVWIDREHAKIFSFKVSGVEEQSVHSRHTDHHTHAFDGKDVNRIENHFYKEILPKISDASELLIVGPGVAKHHFQTYLTEHQPAIAKRLVGCETVDHPTDHQITALARKFFRERIST